MELIRATRAVLGGYVDMGDMIFYLYHAAAHAACALTS